jgi:cyclopropane-fatty-acyl-phospholipid synthase
MKATAIHHKHASRDLRLGFSSFRDLVLRQLSHLKVGTLILRERGEVYQFGGTSADSEVVAEIVVNDSRAYRRTLLGGTIGSAEAYMDGWWSSPEPLNVIRLMLQNQRYLNNMDSTWSALSKFALNILDKCKPNSLVGSKKNIAAHYDLNNDFFSLFLDETMMYSAAIYPNDNSSLYKASVYKLDHICKRLNLTEKDHLLEIGTGWGGLAIHAAKYYGCRVTTTTISDEQYNFAKTKIAEARLEDKVTLLNNDYRMLSGRYDKIVSVEMIEAVGHEYFPQFFKTVNDLLKDDGLALIQAITTDDRRYEKEKNKTDFIRRYIFPGGCLPSNSVIARMLEKHTNMQCVGFEDITRHYARTLADWRANFFNELNAVRALGFNERFIRMWEFYLCYCEGGFTERVINTGQFLFAKPLCRQLPSVNHGQA